MPHAFQEASAEPEYVMIKDEHGVERQWTVIHCPRTIAKNCNLRKLMDLGEDDSDNDSDNESKTTDAQKAIYRSIRKCTRLALNAIVPGASHGKLYWSQITSGERTAIHEEVLDLNPYLKRFPGGWVTEIFMKRQLRTSRDTHKRNKKKRKEKPGALSLLSKKQHSSGSNKTTHTPKGRAPAANTSNSHQESTKTAAQKLRTPDKDIDKGPGPRSQPEAATDCLESSPGSPVVDAPQRETPAAGSKSDTGKRGADTPEPDPAAPLNKKAKTLFSYFQPMKAKSTAPTSNQKGQGARVIDKGNETSTPSASDSDEEDWRDDATRQFANSQAQKRGKGKAPAAKKPGAKPRPKMRAPRSGSNGGDTDEDIFRRTTRAAKQELIDETEGAMEGASKTKPTPKSKKGKDLAEVERGYGQNVYDKIYGDYYRIVPRSYTQSVFNRSMQTLNTKESFNPILCGDSPQVNMTINSYADYFRKISKLTSVGTQMALLVGGCRGWSFRAKERYTGPWTIQNGLKKMRFPILFVSLDADIVTPLPSALKMSRGFGPNSASLLIQKGFGHTSAAHPSLCTAKNIRDYFVEGKVPKNGTYCTPELGWIYPTNSTKLKGSKLSKRDQGLLSAVEQIGETKARLIPGF